MGFFGGSLGGLRCHSVFVTELGFELELEVEWEKASEKESEKDLRTLSYGVLTDTLVLTGLAYRLLF